MHAGLTRENKQRSAWHPLQQYGSAFVSLARQKNGAEARRREKNLVLKLFVRPTQKKLRQDRQESVGKKTYQAATFNESALNGVPLVAVVREGNGGRCIACVGIPAAMSKLDTYGVYVYLKRAGTPACRTW